jgi:Ca-activated chloride channel family protein
MSIRIQATLLLGVLVCLPIHARQAPTSSGVRSVYVLAFQVSGADASYRSCPLAGWPPVRPMSFPGAQLRPPGANAYPSGIPDPTLRADIEKGFHGQKRFTVATSAEQADLVLIAQVTKAAIFTATVPSGPTGPSSTPALPASPEPWPTDTGPPPLPDRWPDGTPFGAAPSGGTFILGGWMDMPANRRTQVVALAVPAQVYRRGPDATEALFEARVWEGWDSGARLVDLVKDFLAGRAKVYTPRGEEQRGVFRPDMPRTVCVQPGPPRAPDASGESAPDVSPTAPPATSAPGVADRPDAGAASLPRFMSGVMAVAVPVVAINDKGQGVAGLTPSDFRVFDDEVEQAIAQFMTESAPLNVTLVMDTSQSMRMRFEEIRGAASAFIDALRPEDRVMVVSLDDRAYVGTEFTSDRNEIRRAILQARIGGNFTRLYDSLDAVLTGRLARVAGRQALVLLTDGVDVGSGFATAPGTRERVQAANVPVYVLEYDTRSDPRLLGVKVLPRGTSVLDGPVYLGDKRPYEAADRYLRDLSEGSGGRVERAATADQMLESFARISAELRQQYVLYYYPTRPGARQPPAARPGAPPRDGAFHRIRIEVNRPGVSVRTRAGYR